MSKNIEFWIKDGSIYKPGETGGKEVGKMYVEGVLLDTKGNYQHVQIETTDDE